MEALQVCKKTYVVGTHQKYIPRPSSLSQWSGQQHLLHWLQALGAQEMQWAQALDKGPCLDVHGAKELHTPLDGRPQRGPSQT